MGRNMKYFVLLILVTVLLSISASIYIFFKSNKCRFDSENEICLEMELNTGTILDPSIKRKINEFKRKLPRQNDGGIINNDENIFVCYRRPNMADKNDNGHLSGFRWLISQVGYATLYVVPFIMKGLFILLGQSLISYLFWNKFKTHWQFISATVLFFLCVVISDNFWYGFMVGMIQCCVTNTVSELLEDVPCPSFLR